MDKQFDLLLTSLWAPETFAKFVFLAVTAPIWWPLAKVMYAEILPALNATEGTSAPRAQPGVDPFLNIPLASQRMRRSEARPVARAPQRRR